MAHSSAGSEIFGAIRAAIEAEIPGAVVLVEGGGGHFSIDVTHPVFAEKSMLASQRLVLGSIKHLMAPPNAPVHAIDSLKTRAPA
jgi:acid stress-induced BolA-like protein IbaG/YrbA